MSNKSFIKPVLFMAIVTVLFAGSLAAVNYITKDQIQFNQDAEQRRKILNVFDRLPEQQDDATIEQVFNDIIVEKTIDGKTGYALVENGEEVAYALEVAGSGLWGSIVGYLGLNSDFTETTGIDFVQQSETPGLGGRIDETPYKEQFRGIDITNAQNGNYLVNRPAPGGNIDAISGATQTSNSVINLVNEDLASFLANPEVK
ncbi:MAG: FMN-binding protein [Tissierellia bacterium]|jgi:Na+-transporting NADH:ubiquinone oxidoreductase subunit C|nr:FMN-binding protein [Tissierellia bacterium]